MSNNVNFNLSIQDTNVLKGLALCFLLCHHLFYSHREPDAVNYFSDVCIHGNWLLARFGNGFGKLCVALFVFLSGYGLTISTEKKGGIHDLIGFYRNRMVKLLVNYWFIWLVFVPYGVLVAGRSFPDVYGEHYVLKTLIDFCGMAYAFGYYGYNATWWFYSCIIVLYFLFPLLYRIREKWWLLVGFVFFYRIVGGHLPILSAGGSYVLAFALGIAMATYRIAPPHTLIMEQTVPVCDCGGNRSRTNERHGTDLRLGSHSLLHHCHPAQIFADKGVDSQVYGFPWQA